ncbi:MAG: ATP-binding protein [Bacteroidetes bacterium]|nr:ATP-binding protein [Bacteroidota bacterium]MBU1721072.1 ATP-binding protein [Bacteroidota bacterium]
MHKVERFIDEICDYFNVNNDYFGNILIAITEAVDNAMQHGNGNVNGKLVTLEFEARDGKLCFSVKDEGDGFDFLNIKDPTDPTIEFTGQGKGIYLMQHLADDIEFKENGREVILKFSISSINNKVATARIEEFMKHIGKSQETARANDNLN